MFIFFRAFCKVCIKDYFQLPASEIVDNWKCFLQNNCRCSKKNHSVTLKVNEAWWSNVSLQQLKYTLKK